MGGKVDCGQLQQRALELIERAGIPLTHEERSRIQVVDFGLGDPLREGAQILTLVQTARISVKLLVLLPHQTEPEHWHPPVGDDPGKEETIRNVFGKLYFYISGNSAPIHARVPEGKEEYYTCRKGIELQPGQQITCLPGQKHWFQTGKTGCVFYSFSTVARDDFDRFTDPAVVRNGRARIERGVDP
jgi:D-lyxose ketol-isomerase